MRLSRRMHRLLTRTIARSSSSVSMTPSEALLRRIANQIAIDNSFIKTSELASLLGEGAKLIPKMVTKSDDLASYLSTRGFGNIISNEGAKKSLAESSDSDESSFCEIDITMKEQQHISALRIISSILTFPLSLSYGIQSILSNYNKDSRKTLKVLILGARSESSLPIHWWKDSLYSSDKFQNLQIEFMGPHLQTSNSKDEPQISADFEWIASTDSSSIKKRLSIKKLSTKNKVLFHNHADKLKYLYNYDIFVLYNPGLGSEPLKAGWKETLRYLLMSKKPVLCTALSIGDLYRDLDYIKALSFEEDDQDLGEPLEFITHPRANPFRSLKRSVDNNEEKEDMKITQTNHYIYSFVSK